jgi:hypothetical protein
MAGTGTTERHLTCARWPQVHAVGNILALQAENQERRKKCIYYTLANVDSVCAVSKRT